MYAFACAPLSHTIYTDELDCQDFVPVTLHVDVDPDKPCESINITSFLVESIDSGCSGSTTYTQFSLSLKAMTSPSVAIATGTVHVRVKYCEFHLKASHCTGAVE